MRWGGPAQHVRSTVAVISVRMGDEHSIRCLMLNVTGVKEPLEFVNEEAGRFAASRVAADGQIPGGKFPLLKFDVTIESRERHRSSGSSGSQLVRV